MSGIGLLLLIIIILLLLWRMEVLLIRDRGFVEEIPVQKKMR